MTVNKVWDDDNNRDGRRPEQVIVYLFADGKVVDRAIITNENNWTYTFNNLDKYNDDTLITYTVEESNVCGYNATYDGTNITNIHKPETIDINITGQWDDLNDTDGIRPDNMTIVIYVDGEPGETIIINETNNWTQVIDDLPKYNNGTEINYTIVQVDIQDGYNNTIIQNGTDFTVIDHHRPETVNLTVTKVWDDNNNNDGKRPCYVAVQLYADGVAQGQLELLANTNNWTYTYINLPKNKDGQAINYSIEEMKVPEGYTSTVNMDNNTATITNTYTDEKINITIIGEWDDINDTDKIRPDNMTIIIYADGEKVTEVIINNQTNWTQIVEDLPKYNNGTQINYTIVQVDIQDGYNNTIIQNGTNFTVIDHHRPVTNITINKIWDDDDNRDGIRPEEITIHILANGKEYDIITINQTNAWTKTIINLPRYDENDKQITYTIRESTIRDYKTQITRTNNTYTVTNNHTPETIEVKVHKVWDDNNNQDGKRPNNVTVTLYANNKAYRNITLTAENNWTNIFTNLPKYEDGIEINYTVDESNKANEYTVEIRKCCQYTIINKYTPETINVTVVQIWDDLDDYDGIRPENVTVQLYVNGEPSGEPITLDSSNNQTYVWENLPKYDENGTLINYTVDEVNIPVGYTKTIIPGNYNFTIINPHRPTRINITINKVWDDNNNQDGKRTDNVKIQLYQDGKAQGQIVILNDNNNWTHTYTNLRTMQNGKQLTYEVKEVEVPEDYTSSTTGKDTKFTITNRHTPETINVTVVQIWDDLDDIDKIRPDYVEVQIYANGEAIGNPIKLSPDNNQSYIWQNLPKYENGILINYTVDEVIIPEGYNKTLINGDYNFTIINPHRPTPKIFKWAWKLIHDYWEEEATINDLDNITDKTPTNNKIIKQSESNIKTSSNIIKNRNYRTNNYYKSYNKHNNRYSNNYHRNTKHYQKLSGYHYRLFIYLYEQYLNGSMSYEDFIALLEQEGIHVPEENMNWNDNGVITIDYDDIDDVPDSITMHNPKSEVPDSFSKVDKSRTPDSNGLIDSGEVEVEY